MEINNQNTNSEAGSGCNCKMCQKFGWCPAGRGHKIVKIILWVIVIAFVISFFAGEHGYNKNNIQKDTITVSGKGEVVVKPDLATVSFSTTAEDLDVSKATDQVNKNMADIVSGLKADGVDEKDIKTTNYSIYPRYNYVGASIYPYNGTQVLAAYVVTQSIELKIRDLSKAGQIITDLGKLNVTDMGGLSFTVDKEDAVKAQARDLAVQDARAQAKVLAKSLGVRLVKITAFSESGNYPIYYDTMKTSSVGMGGAPTTAVIPTGQNTITSNVSITYEIR